MMMDSAIHQKNHYPVDKHYRNQLCFHWIDFIRVEIIIHLANNWGLDNEPAMLEVATKQSTQIGHLH